MHVLQTGTYSSWNKGDAAMQLATATALRAAGAQVTISAPFPLQDRPFYQGLAEVIPCYRRRLIYSGLQLLLAALWRLLRALFGVEADRLLVDEELRATRAADLVIDLSGDMLTDDYGPHVAYSHYIPLMLALLLDRPLFICAQSIGPFRWTGWMARPILRRASKVTVRDELSLRHLADIGFDPNRAELTADMAFQMRPASAERVSDVLAAENCSGGAKPTLAVSLSRILEQRYAAACPQDAPHFVELLASVLDGFATEQGVEVLFIPHVTGPTADKDDRRIAREVAAAMRTPAQVIQADLRPEELKGIIARCALLLGARMHANIAALSSGVPVIALSYSHKTPGIMASFGLAEQVIDGRQLNRDNLQARLRESWRQRAALSEKLRRVFPQLHERSQANVRLALQVMHEAGPARGQTS